MCSIIMHYAITKVLVDKYNIGDEVLFGAILPDLIKDSNIQTWEESHYILESTKLPDIEGYASSKINNRI